MKLAFWNDGAPKIVRSPKHITLPSGDVLMNAKPVPSLDLYWYVETGPLPGEYEYAGPTSYSLDGDTITATRTVVSKDLEMVQAIVKGKIKAKRDAVMNAGIEWNTYVVQTDADSRRELIGAVVGINEGSLTEQAWRMMDNQLVVLTAADFKAMGTAVREHINACYVRQAQLEALVGGATDMASVLAVDIEAGWPAHYSPEEAL